MPQHVAICDQAWVGTTCPGVLTSVDIEPLINSSQPFDWSALDTEQLGLLFAGTFSFVVLVWGISHGAGMALSILRKS